MLNSKGLHQSSGNEKRAGVFVLCLRPPQNLKLVSSRGSRARTAKKCTKKRDARAKLSFYQSKPIASLTFSLPSPSPLLKLPNQSHDYRPLLIRLSCAISIRLGFITSDRSV